MAADATVALRAAVRFFTTRAPRRGLFVALLAALLAAGTLAAAPSPASATTARIKVVIVVGPSGANTSIYLKAARGYAAQARSYGATVVEVYTPNATWTRVKSVAQGANLLMYLGHGNGFPNPYSSTFDPKKVDGLGSTRMRAAATRAPGTTARPIFRAYPACAQRGGDPEPRLLLGRKLGAGQGEPDPFGRSQRVDNFGAGFLRTGARAVFAETLASATTYRPPALHEQPDDVPDLLVRPGAEGHLHVPVHLGPHAGSDRDHRSVTSRGRTTGRSPARCR